MDENELMLHFYDPAAHLDGFGLVFFADGMRYVAKIERDSKFNSIPVFFFWGVHGHLLRKTYHLRTILAYFPAEQMQAYARVAAQAALLLEMQ